MHNGEARNVGMMCECLKHAKSVVWRMHIGSPDFARHRPCTGSLAMPTHGLSASYVGEKNSLRNLWDGALGLVRPPATSSAGSAVWEPPRLFGTGGATRSVPPVRHREGRATGELSRERTAHGAFCPLRRETLPQRDDQGRSRGVEPRLAHCQASGEALYARTAEA